MDYKAEVMVNKKLVHSLIYKNYTHPNQVVKLIANKIKNKYDYYNIFVMNTFGEVWHYGVEKTKEGYKAWQLGNDIKNKNQMLMVFSGNTVIADILGD